MVAYVKDLSIILAGLIALVTFMTGTWQFMRQARYTRVQNFLELRRRFLEDPVFRDLLNRLAVNDPTLAEAPIQDRRNLVGFFEEIALLINSGVLRPLVANYMFGYYVALIGRSDPFWQGLDRDSVYWTVFRRLEARLAKLEKEAGRAEPLKF